MVKNILIFCAHEDDEVLGAGGSIPFFISEKKKVVCAIFYEGESSHPWMKKEVITKIRHKESEGAAKLLGSKNIYLNFDEFKTVKKENFKLVKKEVEKLIKKLKPEKIFTHSSDDVHHGHRAVHQIVLEVCDKLKQQDVYTFDVWNPINLNKRNLPKLYIDITNTFRKKIKAVKIFKSQKLQMQLPLTWSVYTKAIKGGLENGTRFAEVFFKIR